MPSEAALPSPLLPPDASRRAKAYGYAWLAALGLLGLLLLQAVTGWPLRVRQAIPTFPAGVPFKVRLPSRAPGDVWHQASTRVWKDGQRVPMYRNQALLQQSGREGYSPSDKWVSVQRQAGAGQARWILDAPLDVAPSLQLGLTLVVALWGVWLVRTDNPLVLRWAGWFGSPAAAWLLAGVGLALFAAAILLRVMGFSYPAWLNDTGSHYPAVFQVATGGSPIVTPDRPFGLPLVMGHLLRWWADLRIVVAAQSAATLLAAAAAGLCTWWASSRLFQHPLARNAGRLSALLAFTAIALSESMLEREWALLAEAWVAFYLGAQLLLAWLLTARLRRLAPALVVHALLCLAGLLAFFTRPNWGIALGMLPLPWLVTTVLSVDNWKRRLAWFASGAAVLLAMAALTFGYQRTCTSARGSAALEERARALICWHIALVRPEISARLAAQPASPEAPLLREVAALMDAERERAKTEGPGAYPSIGYDADHLYFTGLPYAPLFSRLTSEERTRFCSELFWTSLRHRPGIYLAKVFGQFPRFFARPYESPKISVGHVLSDYEQSRRAAQGEWAIPEPILTRYFRTLDVASAELQRPWPSPARLSLSLREVLIFDVLNGSFRWLLGASLLICAAAAILPAWRAKIAWRTTAPAWATATWALGSILLSALTAALVQGLDVQRYLELFMPLTLFCHVLWPLLAACCLASLRRETRV